jgi:hypothetical protein
MYGRQTSTVQLFMVVVTAFKVIGQQPNANQTFGFSDEVNTSASTVVLLYL